MWFWCSNSARNSSSFLLMFLKSGTESKLDLGKGILETKHTNVDLRVVIWVCVCVFVRMCVCMYVCIYVCMCVRMYVRTYVCIYLCMYVCVYVCMYVCTYVCMYVCMNKTQVLYNPNIHNFGITGVQLLLVLLLDYGFCLLNTIIVQTVCATPCTRFCTTYCV